MRKTRTQLAKFAAIAMLSVGAMALSASTVGAAVDLSATDLSSINTAMANAIANAKAGLAPNAGPLAVEAAVAAAISNETQTLISQYAQTSAMIVAEAAITGAADAGASPREIGKGMATAALAENQNPAAGIEIADAVGATAPNGAIRAFDETADASGTQLGQALASAAASYENVGAGGRGNGGNGNGGNGGNGIGGFGNGGNGGNGGGGGGGGGCRNPSCT
jgi:uncharacterized membrane protein YgcG